MHTHDASNFWRLHKNMNYAFPLKGKFLFCGFCAILWVLRPFVGFALKELNLQKAFDTVDQTYFAYQIYFNQNLIIIEFAVFK